MLSAHGTTRTIPGCEETNVHVDCNLLSLALEPTSPSPLSAPALVQAQWESLSPKGFSPDHAAFWRHRKFSNFMVDISLLPDLTLDREAWSTVFADKHTSLVNDFDAIEHWERKIIDSGSPFGVALAALRERHAGWPFMDSRLECSVLSAQCSWNYAHNPGL